MFGVELLEAFEELPQEIKPPMLKLIKAIQESVGEVVKREDFLELKSAIAKLEEAQKKTEESMKKLWDAMAELTEAHKRSEERLTRLELTVQELAEAQKRSEERLTRLEKTVEELAEAQKRSEERLTKLEITVQELIEAQKKTEKRVEELAEAQKKSEERLTRLEKTVQELAEAQKKSEERLTRLEKTVEELAEAQKKSEERLTKLELTVQELAEAQKQTEKELKKLARGLERTRREVGGLSRSVAYALENEAFRFLPPFLKERFGIEVVDRIVRADIDGNEVNLFCKAKKDGKEFYLVGEATLRLDDPSKLKQVWENVEVVKNIYGENVIPIVVTHFAKKNVLEIARKSGIIVVQSFEW